MVNVLSLEPWLFYTGFGIHRMRIFVDGVDVVTTAYGPGGFFGQAVTGFTPSRLLGPDGLAASAHARDVPVGGSSTTEDQLTVQICQVGATVIWDHWQMTDMGKLVKNGQDVGLPTFRFDAGAYASELTRAQARTDRKWPARSVAERLTLMLRDNETGTMWIRRVTGVHAPENRPAVIEVSYYARDMSGLRYAMPGHYIVTFPVDASADPHQQAEAIAHRVSHEDLKPISLHRPRRRRT
ncbi:hypothetical protein [Paractinoplanes atraurantiacus]|uniref:Uncharacterized protein n=1 Tax=Paractinoplanes atraurantiacus TaxID=1036182 RepID=A0A285IGF2_9ACTN|nr:hypothetical protein [Actinoplanes atraurantiacus]SNY47080.1 hypothetical protein SAMN05421748_10864 [Actinoplanes atraurantiacus]